MARIGSTWTRKLGFFIAFAYGALNTRYGFNIEPFTGSPGPLPARLRRSRPYGLSFRVQRLKSTEQVNLQPVAKHPVSNP